jgi:Ca2+-binding RTX toxin-like protein
LSYSDIKKAVEIDGDFSREDRNEILGVIKEAYAKSSIARAMFDHWVDDLGREIKFIYNEGDFSAWNGKVWLDMRELDNASYIDKHGNAIRDFPFTAIIHELGHALTAREDNWTTAEPAGDNQLFVNKIYKQAGYTEQLAYMAYDASGDVIQRGVDYTDGARIDSAWVKKWDDLPNDYDTTQGGTFNKPYRDLVIGSADQNSLKSGGGNDFIYGLAGDDELFGGAGSDRLNGGEGMDILRGGGGRDFASYKLADTGVTADLAIPAQNTFSAFSDSYFSIEGLIGSDHADSLFGDGNRNFMEGRRGSDSFTGRGGDDEIDGGKGLDRAFYELDFDAYTVKGGKGTVSGDEEGTDRLKDVEYAYFADGIYDFEAKDFIPFAI